MMRQGGWGDMTDLVKLPPKSWDGSNPGEYESIGNSGDQVRISSMSLEVQQLRWIILAIEEIARHLNYKQTLGG